VLAAPPRPRVSTRLTGIDAARALAFGGMLLAHFAASRRSTDPGWLQAVDNAADGRAAPLFCLLLGVGAGLLAAVVGGVVGLVVAALAVGTAASAGKQCFDSIVQRDAPDANRGRSFARFETRFQLVWVLGGFLPVVVAIPARIGYVVLAAAAGFALSTYLAGQRGIGRRRGAGRGPFDMPAAETAVVGPRPEGEPALAVDPERRAP